MRHRLIILYLLVVIVPLAAVTWLGVALAQREQAQVAMRFREVIGERLGDVDAGIQDVVANCERAVQGSARSTDTVEALRQSAFESSIVRHYFVTDGNGRLIYPLPGQGLTDEERDFLLRTQVIWDNGEIPSATPEAGGSVAQLKQTGPQQQGWHAGYWEHGIRLIYWWRDAPDSIVGAEINAMRLLSDIIAVLPATWSGDDSASPLSQGRIELADERGGVMYQWGDYVGPADERPFTSIALRAPLHFWRLRYFAAPSSLTPDLVAGIWFNVAAGVAVLGIALSVLAALFYREQQRALREAAQRVSFVNQVSHELKTPLTNIRLYAELLDNELADADSAARKRLNIIVSESQRLSRLIGNVLTFSREEHKGITLRRSEGCVDDVVRSTLDQFEEPLRARGVTIVCEASAPGIVSMDKDAVGQILGNLLSNVEKYGGQGEVRIHTEQKSDVTTIIVSDHGPGIPGEHASRIFDPFHRVSHAINEGTSGVGLGLTIARRLAQLHGGDITLLPVARGASFRVTLKTPAASPEKNT